MRVIIVLLLFVFTSKTDGVCYVPDHHCTHNISLNQVCGTVCKEELKKKCPAVILYTSNQVNGNVLLKAFPAAETKSVYFNVSLLEKAWKTFRIKIFGEDPQVFLCRTYTNSGSANTSFDFHIKINANLDYYNFSSKRYMLQYQINNEKNSSFGRFLFYTPSYYRYHTPPLNDLELFTYVDNSRNNILKLNVMAPSQMYNIPKYRIELYQNKVNMVSNATLPMLGNRLTYTYNATDKPGDYFFVVYPNTTACNPDGCFKSMTPTVDLSTTNWTVVIIIVAVILVIFFCIALCCCCIKGCSLCGACTICGLTCACC